MGLLDSLTSATGMAKMKLTGYNLITFSGATVGPAFELQVNPETISLSYEIEPDEGKSTDANATTPGSSTYKLPKLEIETWADATGVLRGIGDKDKKLAKDVSEFIDKLKKTVYNYIEDTHGPPYVAIEWGSVATQSTNQPSTNSAFFKGQLTSMDIEYSLFSKEGVPVRAKIKMTFQGIQDPKTRPLGASPDLTHIHQIQMGDNLPMLSQKVYSRPQFYMQLAKINGLSSVYQLKPGVQLVIPPLEKASR